MQRHRAQIIGIVVAGRPRADRQSASGRFARCAKAHNSCARSRLFASGELLQSAGASTMPGPTKSPTIKRSVAVAGRKTSVNLEDSSWYALRRLASDRGMTIGDLVTAIGAGKQHGDR